MLCRIAAAVSEDSAGHLFPRMGQPPGRKDSDGGVGPLWAAPGEVVLIILRVLPTVHTRV